MKLIHGDCLQEMPKLQEASIDAVVTDPPYGLSFMGKDWDHGIPGVAFWREALRVAKPGAHLLAFGGTRTFHRLACAIEDAGWEIRDCLMWVYGSGFPKSLDVAKAIDKAAGAERAVVGRRTDRAATPIRDMRGGRYVGATKSIDMSAITAPATDAAKQWDGWGTALKPAWEPIIMARKPLDGTVAANVLKHGTGALNIDGCRIPNRERTEYGLKKSERSRGSTYGTPNATADFDAYKGRWPANLIHDGSEEVVGLFPKAKGAVSNSSGGMRGNTYSGATLTRRKTTGRGDSGSAARFFYTAKASGKDRGNRLAEGLPLFGKFTPEFRNDHPTVKPVDLMKYLLRLVVPPGGIVLDPFMGSGSTLVAAKAHGCGAVGIEIDKHYCEIAAKRLRQNVLTKADVPTMGG